MTDKTLLSAFAARAEQKRKSRMEFKKFEVPGIGPVPFQKLSPSASVDFMARVAEGSERGADGYADVFNARAELIYDCCPTLQDVDLLRELGTEDDPYSTIPLLMDMTEISKLADELMIWMGMAESDKKDKKDKKVKDVKNS